MKRIFAVLILFMALLALWLWNAGHSRSPAGIDSKASAQPDGRDDELTTDPAMSLATRTDAQRDGAEVAPTATTSAMTTGALRIRSSVGLPLPFAEIERAAGEWSEIALDDGTCARSQIANALSVRGPGHVAATVVPDAKEIVLEPDALLVIESDSLRACTRAIEPHDQYTDPETDEPLMRSGLRHAVAFGWLSDKKWAIALTPDRLEEGYRNECEILLHWRDERTAWITFHGASGCRETWTIDCEQRIQGLPLVVQIVRPPGLPPGQLEIALDKLTDGSTGSVPMEFQWGRVYVDDQEFHELRKIAAGSSTVSFDFAPVAARMTIAARDAVSGVYGRLGFVHDGSQRTLVLSPPFRLTGRLVPSEGAALPPHADMMVSGFEGEEEVAQWDMGKQGVVLDAAGIFVLMGPGHLLRGDYAQLQVPSRLVVHIQVPGFEPWEQPFETHHAAALDCGDIHLASRPAEVVLAPGHGLTVKSVKWEGLITPGEPQSWWNIRDAVLQPDGSMQIYLQRDEKDPKLLSIWAGTARAWPKPPPDALVIHVILDEGDIPMAFERNDEGRYTALATRVRDIDFDNRSAKDRARWTIGWEWHGVTDACGSIDPMQFGEMVHLHVRAPDHGVTLSWTTDWEHRMDAGARGGSAAIDLIREPVILH